MIWGLFNVEYLLWNIIIWNIYTYIYYFYLKKKKLNFSWNPFFFKLEMEIFDIGNGNVIIYI